MSINTPLVKSDGFFLHGYKVPAFEGKSAIGFDNLYYYPAEEKLFSGEKHLIVNRLKP